MPHPHTLLSGNTASHVITMALLFCAFVAPLSAQTADDTAWDADPQLQLQVFGMRAVGDMNGGDDVALMASHPGKGFGVGAQMQLPVLGQWLRATAGLSYNQLGVGEPTTNLRVPDKGRVDRGWRAVPLLAGLRAEDMPSPMMGFYATLALGAAAITPPAIEHSMLGGSEQRSWDTEIAFVWSAGVGMLVHKRVDIGLQLLSASPRLYEGSTRVAGEGVESMNTLLHFSTLQFVLGVRL
ncbi:MAG: hypothetical protein RRA94_12590 [Bacteroidota bacterium]|nr:hypothetical protein [Bacteroidota bacterium]